MFRFGRPGFIATLVFGAAGAIAACGGSVGTGAPSTAVPSGLTFVQASDQGGYMFTPSALIVPAGSSTFSVRNAGTEIHEFEIFKGDIVVDEVENIVPGMTKELTVTLEAGEYTFVCKVNGHDLAGMKGTLTVQ